MVIRKIAVLVVACLVVLVGMSKADDNSEGLTFRSSVIGTTGFTTPGTIAGVPLGGADWAVKNANAALDSDGKLRVQVQGLLISAAMDPSLVGTTGPVTQVVASLVCGGSGGMVEVTTTPIPLAPDGDAIIDQVVTFPTTPFTCVAPVILVRAAAADGTPGPIIAATGFTTPTPKGGGQGHGHKSGHGHH